MSHPPEPTIFYHGVASGDMGESDAIIWTRLSGQTSKALVEWQVIAEDSGKIEAAGTEAASAAHDFTVKGHPTNLRPGTSYRYQFFSNTDDSPIGRFKTLGRKTESIRIAVVSCAKFNAGYFHAYQQIATEDIDAVIHLGDYIYETANVPPKSQTPGASIGRDFAPPGECRTLDQYRMRYSQYRLDPDVQALHAAHGMLCTIDDHEIADNAWRSGADEHRAAEHGPFEARLNNALRAWEEWMPVRRSARSGSPIYSSWRLGELLTILLLETRTDRSAPYDSPGRSELGRAQLAWLGEQIGSSSSTWVLLCSPSLMSPIWVPNMGPAAVDSLSTLKLIESDGSGPFHDLWDCFADERTKILDLLANSPSRPLIVSGDVHVSVDSTFEHQGRLIPEWTGPSVTSQNLDDKKGWIRHTTSTFGEAEVLESHPWWNYCNFDDHGFLLLTVGAEQVQCDWRFVGDVRDPKSEKYIGHSARWPTPIESTEV